MVLKKSENANINYLAIISRITSIKPIENSDRLSTTVLNGYNIIVQNTTKVGDIVVFFPQESCICEEYLSANNQYGISDYEKNANAYEVASLIDASMNEPDSDKSRQLMDEAKSKIGFFNKYGRVTMLKLRGEYSCGFVMPISSMEIAFPELKDTDWDSLVGTEFNMVNDTLFIWKYIPIVRKRENNRNPKGSRRHRRFQKKMTRFDRIIPGMFSRHYETEQIEKSIRDIKQDDVISVNVKLHGSSGIFSNILCNRKLSTWEKIKKFFGFNVVETEFGNVYSSRNVIKNQYINNNVNAGFYDKDLWSPVNEMLKPYIEKGMTIYGEIVGYVEGTDKPIQPKHDYGCEVGEWKFLPYRITTTDETTGRKLEWNVLEVDEWTHKFVSEHPEYSKNIIFFEHLYHGKFCDLYPDLDVNSETWYDDVLYRMKNEKRWLMEEKEPLCHRLDKAIENKRKELKACRKGSSAYKKVKKELDNLIADEAPREGVVIRIDNDVYPRAWKLKTLAHYNLSKKAHDNGEIDIEEMDGMDIEEES